MINEFCPNGVEFKPLAEVCNSLKKNTLKKEQLINNGDYYVVNSGREYYGKYNLYNNDGNSFTFASRGEYAGFLKFHDSKF